MIFTLKTLLQIDLNKKNSLFYKPNFLPKHETDLPLLSTFLLQSLNQHTKKIKSNFLYPEITLLSFENPRNLFVPLLSLSLSKKLKDAFNQFQPKNSPLCLENLSIYKGFWWMRLKESKG